MHYDPGSDGGLVLTVHLSEIEGAHPQITIKDGGGVTWPIRPAPPTQHYSLSGTGGVPVHPMARGGRTTTQNLSPSASRHPVSAAADRLTPRRRAAGGAAGGVPHMAAGGNPLALDNPMQYANPMTQLNAMQINDIAARGYGNAPDPSLVMMQNALKRAQGGNVRKKRRRKGLPTEDYAAGGPVDAYDATPDNGPDDTRSVPHARGSAARISPQWTPPAARPNAGRTWGSFGTKAPRIRIHNPTVGTLPMPKFHPVQTPNMERMLMRRGIPGMNPGQFGASGVIPSAAAAPGGGFGQMLGQMPYDSGPAPQIPMPHPAMPYGHGVQARGPGFGRASPLGRPLV